MSLASLHSLSCPFQVAPHSFIFYFYRAKPAWPGIIGICDRYWFSLCCHTQVQASHCVRKQTWNWIQSVINLEPVSRRMSVDGCESVNNSWVSQASSVALIKHAVCRFFGCVVHEIIDNNKIQRWISNWWHATNGRNIQKLMWRWRRASRRSRMEKRSGKSHHRLLTAIIARRTLTSRQISSPRTSIPLITSFKMSRKLELPTVEWV